MECTQKLECLTQEFYESRQDRSNSEEIGFLGICGTKYPIKRGPNKIGRDPQTCNIVLDLNSVSRQHAVINVLNSKEFMIMDLDSANKTKLLNKSLQPYIPHPLKNGDTVQFGHIFGIFRLFEDDDDLPMTQALEIPDTPVVNRHVAKLNHLPSTTIPESPDCSDKDESFIVSSQAKTQDVFISPNRHFTKNIGKTIAIQPIGENKIDNAYWKSTKKSLSIDISLDDSNEDLVGTVKSLTTAGSDKNEDIHEMDTQVPYPILDRFETLSTDGPSISGLDTHLIKMNNLPGIQKTNKQQDMKLDLFMENKENNNSIFNAETQQLDDNIAKNVSNNENANKCTEGSLNPNFNISDEEIIFDEVQSQPLPDNFESQPLLPENFIDADIKEDIESKTDDADNFKNGTILNNKKINRTRTRLNSDSSTDCDDFEFLPTQKIPEKPECNEGIKSENNLSKPDCKTVNANDDSTDCEDNVIETDPKADPIKGTHAIGDGNDSTDCEDDIMPCISDALTKKYIKGSGFEDLPTQVIAIDKPQEIDKTKDKSLSDFDFEDMPTQVIESTDIESTSKTSENDFNFEDLPTQVISMETQKEIVKQNDIPAENLPFKVPLPSIKKNKKKEIVRPDLEISTHSELVDDNFYNATQEIFNDLCTQNETNTEKEQYSLINCGLDSRMKEAIAEKKVITALVVDKSSERNHDEEKVSKFAKGSHNSIKDVIGVDKHKNQKPIRNTSDSSDLEITPKKRKRFMETDLPNSQEIKKSVTLKTSIAFVESSTDSEPEEVEECVTVVSQKSKSHKNAKIDLSKKFETELLPTRLLTRVRKPTAKAQNSNFDIKKMIRSRLVASSEENIDTEIIMENMLRLKTKTSKHKSDDDGRKSSEAKNEDKHKLDEEHSKPACIQLPPEPINENNKRSDEKINTKRKSDDSGICDNKKTEKNNEKKRNESNRHNNNTKSSEIRTRRDKKSFNLQKEDKTNKKDDIPISDKTSERPSRRSPRTIEKGHGDNKVEKTRGKSENVASNKRVRNQKEESKQTLPDKIDSNVKTSRRTRSKQKEASQRDESKSSAKDKTESDKRDKRKRNTEEGTNETSDKEMRRSKRQKTIKSYLEPNSRQYPNSSISSRSSKHEQSTVYNISAESSNEKSPIEKSVKKTVKEDDVNNVKRKSAPNLSNNISLRSTPRNIKIQKVLFTAFPCEEVKEKLMQLGAIVVNELAECTVLLTLQIKRTFKLLCAIGLGRPIVGPSWVQACVDTNMIVDPWLYIIKDEASEKRFQFNLERTLTGKRNFLQGYNVSSTPSIVPKSSEMKLIVESSGGTWKEGGSKWICITCNSDKVLWLSLKRKGAVLVSTEFILEGVLQQKLNIGKHRLS